jgi:CHAD domain-containing protein
MPTHTELIDSLREHMHPIMPENTMAEAGRKALLPDFVSMLEHEAGSRTGADIEDVHDMRVATRRMRSVLRLLSAYYKPKAIRPHLRGLRRVARVLGTVRDLDVLIDNLQQYQKTLDEGARAALQAVIEYFDHERQYARRDLDRTLDKSDYRRFTHEYAAWLTTERAARASDSDDVHPSQVRHLLPSLIYEHLGVVRAYDAMIADGDAVTLHALRIEFKRLRYLVSMFSSVMGSSAKEFVSEIKTVQDHLGRMNDLHVAQDRLCELLPTLDAASAAVLDAYIDSLRAEEEQLRVQTIDVWKRFNSKTVQRQLATAIAAL